MSPEKVFISLIIPALNEEKYLASCLQSVFSQTYPAELIEVFIIDGGSSDSTVEIVKYWQKDHKNVFLLFNNRKIQSAAFNLGVEKAKGDIIVRWDAHCIYDPEYIHYCVLNHMENEYGNVGGSITVLPGSDTLMGRAIACLNTSFFGLGGAAFRLGGKKRLVTTVPFGAFTKEVVLKVGKMNENLPRGEDNEYNSRILRAGYKIILDPRIVSYYYSRGTLRSFLLQMYDNGFSVGVLIRMSLKYVNLRHVVPLFFVLFLCLGTILSFVNPTICIFFLSSVSLYFILDIIFGFMVAVKNEIKIAPHLVHAAFWTHLSYGIGTLSGLIKGRYQNN